MPGSLTKSLCNTVMSLALASRCFCMPAIAAIDAEPFAPVLRGPFIAQVEELQWLNPVPSIRANPGSVPAAAIPCICRGGDYATTPSRARKGIHDRSTRNTGERKNSARHNPIG